MDSVHLVGSDYSPVVGLIAGPTAPLNTRIQSDSWDKAKREMRALQISPFSFSHHQQF